MVFFLEKLGFPCIYIDHSIFILSESYNNFFINIFVNDIKIIDIKKSENIAKIKKKLVARFLKIDLGLISFFFSLKIERDKEKRIIKLFQPTYINKIFSKYHLN